VDTSVLRRSGRQTRPSLPPRVHTWEKDLCRFAYLPLSHVARRVGAAIPAELPMSPAKRLSMQCSPCFMASLLETDGRARTNLDSASRALHPTQTVTNLDSKTQRRLRPSVVPALQCLPPTTAGWRYSWRSDARRAVIPRGSLHYSVVFSICSANATLLISRNVALASQTALSQSRHARRRLSPQTFVYLDETLSFQRFYANLRC
jgi:hypothetical protein